ncbi:hypothetical protein [Candidatus Endolissoclinum faulkneri]|uniref:hypothetical protein n=1 Tax=Candidatus Endolissoclinum faulkneri TaxID=1263979 RepID=UPI000403A763|nr:hypothetical protein [Candidatus Endolissoclinum faulkneri]
MWHQLAIAQGKLANIAEAVVSIAEKVVSNDNWEDGSYSSKSCTKKLKPAKPMMLRTIAIESLAKKHG